MSEYKHGIEVAEIATTPILPEVSTAALTVAFGTAPVHLASDLTTVLKPKLIYNMDGFKKAFGYSDDWGNYTLCQVADAFFNLYKIAPVVFCNVLDPKTHVSSSKTEEVAVNAKKAVMVAKDVLLEGLKVNKEGTTLTLGTDYLLSFDTLGQVVITLLSSGDAATATALQVEYKNLDPAAVTSTDLIGGHDAETGEESGFELLRQIYPRMEMVPSLIIAPGWSHIPEVAAVLAAKCHKINLSFSAACLLDLDTGSTGAKKYTDCKKIKEEGYYFDCYSSVLWPKIRAKGRQYYYSTIFAAVIIRTDLQNGEIPSLSPSNKLLGIEGTVLEDGTEVLLDITQANELNGEGITTALLFGGWKTWGNNTAGYPGITDPKDRWFHFRRFFTWWGNRFILEYAAKVDDPTKFRLIQDLCDSENIFGNNLKSQGHCAGAVMEYRQEENPLANILNGKIQFRQKLAPYPPAEYILNVLEFDPEAIKNELGGGAQNG